jgi:uncharacterized membrane protein
MGRMTDTPEQRPSDEEPAAEEPAAEEPAAAEPAAAEPTPEETVTSAQVRVRRSPRYFRFMIAGAVLFAIVALILTYSFPENPTYDRGSVFGFLLAICATIGVALGAVVALVLDRATARRARTVQADRIDVRVPEPGSPPARREGSQPEPGDQSSQSTSNNPGSTES